MNVILVALIFPFLVAGKFSTKNYCCLSCGNKHVMCKYQRSLIGPNCREFVKVVLHRTTVLNLYNRMKSVKGVYAGSSNIQRMEWDFELGEMAQRWANQCPNTTDECRDTARGKVNQIVDYIINEQFVIPTWESVFLKWYIQDIPKEHIESYKEDGMYSSLSQLIWAKTTHVGCAATSHLIDTGRRVVMVCNYSPPGNIPGEPIFNLTGGMCTQCPTGSECVDRTNVNLCISKGITDLQKNYLTFISILKFVYAFFGS